MAENLLRRFTEEELLSELKSAVKNDRTFNGYGNIFLLWNDVVAKRKTSGIGLKEYQMGNLLLVYGISVPRMYNLIENVEDEKILGLKGYSNFLIMERINGKELAKVSGKQRIEAERQLRKEVEKAREFGIIPGKDVSFGGNSIWSDDEKLYLIDFESWTRKYNTL